MRIKEDLPMDLIFGMDMIGFFCLILGPVLPPEEVHL